MNKRQRILVSAYACEPNKGSEPEVGWQWIQQLARQHDICVLTRTNNRDVIEQSDISKHYPNLHFEYIDLPRWASFWKKGSRGVHLYYTLWQLSAILRGWRLHKREKFDLTHHLTFSPVYSSPFISLLPIPFIWGPIGAGEILPRQYWALFTFRQKMREGLRLVIRKLTPWNPIIFFAMRKACFIIAATQETRMVIPKMFRHKVIVEAQIGMNVQAPTSEIAATKNNDIFDILTAGRHVYWKGHILIIRAFAKFVEMYGEKTILTVLSNGPEHNRLIAEAENLGISNQVKFLKWLPSREDVFNEYVSADIFAYCSFFECGGYVVLEAMACGTPVVSLELGGPGEIVTEDNGLLVTPESINATVASFAQAFNQLASDRRQLAHKAEQALQRVENEFSWNRKGDRILALIEKIEHIT